MLKGTGYSKGSTFLEVIFALLILGVFGLGIRLFENRVVNRLNRYRGRFKEYEKLQQFSSADLTLCKELEQNEDLKKVVCAKKGLKPEKIYRHTFLVED